MKNNNTKLVSSGLQQEDHTPSTKGQEGPHVQRGGNELPVESGESTATSAPQPATFPPASATKSDPSFSISEPMLASFVVVAYNQEKYIREAVEGAFSQTYSALEILLSDDCSTDSTFAIMQEMAREYKGPHKVILNRNEKNLGIAGHVNKSFEMAKGDIWIGAAGDDISLPDRTAKIMQKFHLKTDVYCCFSYSELFGEESGIMKPYHKEDITGPILASWCAGIPNGSTMAYRMDVYNAFGDIHPNSLGEDMSLFYRSLFLGRGELIPSILVKRRRHVEAVGWVNKSEGLKQWRLIRKMQWIGVSHDLKKLNISSIAYFFALMGIKSKALIDSLQFDDDYCSKAIVRSVATTCYKAISKAIYIVYNNLGSSTLHFGKSRRARRLRRPALK